jgi:acetyl/propionyl-CoA carboxylase alpha subunit
MNMHSIDVVETEPGVYSVLIDGASYEVRVLGGEVTVNGHLFEIALDDPRQWRRPNGLAGAQGRVSINAPMPGKVVRLLVAVGDQVTAGQPVVVVEAMKMQNELKSLRPGRVTAIRVQENDSVNAGAVLLVIE